MEIKFFLKVIYHCGDRVATEDDPPFTKLCTNTTPLRKAMAWSAMVSLSNIQRMWLRTPAKGAIVLLKLASVLCVKDGYVCGLNDSAQVWFLVLIEYVREVENIHFGG